MIPFIDPSDTELTTILNGLNSLTDIGRSKDLARIGDSIINLAFSLAYSRICGRFEGIKLSKKVQAQALRDAGLRECTQLRADAHDLADSVEAFCAYAYYKLDFSIEYMAEILHVNMKDMPHRNTNDKIKAAIWGVTALLITIRKTFNEKINH
jgi:hypothetical protein